MPPLYHANIAACIRPSRIAVILVTLCWLLGSWQSGSAAELTVGVYENPPLIFTDDSGKTAGLFPELLEEIAARENWQITYQPASWPALLKGLDEGSIDLLPAIAYSSERSKRFSFSDETILVNWAEAYSSGNRTLSSLLDLEGSRVAVKAGDIHFQALRELTKKFGITCRFIETDEYSTIFEMLDAGYLDIGIVNRFFGDANRQSYTVRVSPIIFNPIELRFASPKGRHQEILFTLDQHIRQQKEDAASVYHQAIKHWLASEQTGHLPVYLFYVIGGLTAAFLLLAGLSLLLKYQIARQTRTLTATNLSLKEEMRKRQKSMHELKKYARVVEASSDAVALLDREHTHLLVNSAYLRTFQVERDSLHTRSLPQVIGQELFAATLQAPIAMALNGEQVSLTLSRHGADSSLSHLSIQLGPYMVSDSYILGYTLDIRDITQQVKLENQLKQAQKMEAIGLLAGGVAHDLNNILSGLVSYPDMLLVNRSTEDPMYKPLQIIRNSGQRAAAIVSDLLTLARRGVDNLQPVNFNSLIEEFVASPEYGALLRTAPGVTVEIDTDGELLHVPGSPVHLTKCLMNLFTNSLEAMPEGGLLAISTENRHLEKEELPRQDMQAGEYVQLTVTDTGQGMDQQTIQRIFEPFYTSKVMGRSGTGLGMTLVWNAVKDHLGHISVESSPGKGTCFSLLFPATRRKAAQRIEKNHEEFKGNGESILVIDDMEEQRQFASEMLTMLGYRVETAASGEEAIAMVRENGYDLLVLDMIMPGGIDGLATYRQILAFAPQQKAVIASGFSEADNIRQVKALGATQLVRKPYTVLSLASAIHRTLHPSDDQV